MPAGTAWSCRCTEGVLTPLSIAEGVHFVAEVMLALLEGGCLSYCSAAAVAAAGWCVWLVWKA
jgi:hypothetical protein